mmetsp:Transcript_21497/g.59524  ORF Transcript_21497/g.59524 Transcript_21497/m.59524 type:complete len:221 (-) Transcript_21497:2699-3361(-)
MCRASRGVTRAALLFPCFGELPQQTTCHNRVTILSHNKEVNHPQLLMAHRVLILSLEAILSSCWDQGAACSQRMSCKEDPPFVPATHVSLAQRQKALELPSPTPPLSPSNQSLVLLHLHRPTPFHFSFCLCIKPCRPILHIQAHISCALLLCRLLHSHLFEQHLHLVVRVLGVLGHTAPQLPSVGLHLHTLRRHCCLCVRVAKLELKAQPSSPVVSNLGI